MPCHSRGTLVIDEHALNAALLAKGLVLRSNKWNQVRYRIAHRFRVEV